ncbi:hypothetical protein [Burkholderia plantarii]|nr:hypothetical protein [Burkholderia plantarii]MBI0331219.1 hypothetical protein [Burkholderia plantarii]
MEDRHRTRARSLPFAAIDNDSSADGAPPRPPARSMASERAARVPIGRF